MLDVEKLRWGCLNFLNMRVNWCRCVMTGLIRYLFLVPRLLIKNWRSHDQRLMCGVWLRWLTYYALPLLTSAPPLWNRVRRLLVSEGGERRSGRLTTCQHLLRCEQADDRRTPGNSRKGLIPKIGFLSGHLCAGFVWMGPYGNSLPPASTRGKQLLSVKRW